MKFPPTFRRIINELEATGVWGESEVICRLLDLSREARDDLCRLVHETRRRVRQDGRTHDATMVLEGGSGGVTFFATKLAFADDARARLPHYMDFKRTELGAKQWIGFLSIVGRKELVDTFVFLGED